MNITKYSKNSRRARRRRVRRPRLGGACRTGTAVDLYAGQNHEGGRNNLKVGTSISYSCGNCGAVVTTTVTSERSFMKGFTCPGCKRTFRVISPGGGSKATHSYVLADSYGKIAHLSTGGKL